MAEREVLERDAGSPGGEGTQEGPERGRKKHRHPRGDSDMVRPRVYASLSRGVTQAGQPSGIIGRDR